MSDQLPFIRAENEVRISLRHVERIYVDNAGNVWAQMTSGRQYAVCHASEADPDDFGRRKLDDFMHLSECVCHIDWFRSSLPRGGE